MPGYDAAIARVSVNLSRWETWRIKFWVRLGQVVRAQRIILKNIERNNAWMR